MALSKKEENRVSARIFSCLSVVVALVLLVMGVACWKAGASVESMIKKNLVAEKVYFPPKDSPAFAPTVFPDAQKYAGMQVDDAAKVKAYAEDFLGVQSKLLSNGKTLSEVSADFAADPQNPALQQLHSTKFQLETAKGQLLTVYGAASQGIMMQQMGMLTMFGGVALLVVAGVLFARYKRLQ